MTDPKKRRTEKELLDALHDMEALEETAAMSDEQIAADIAASGGDPRAIGARGAAFANELHKKVLPRELLAGGMPREVLIAQVEQAAKRDARVAAALRGRAPRDLSDEELKALLGG
jgi:hypothetical protein